MSNFLVIVKDGSGNDLQDAWDGFHSDVSQDGMGLILMGFGGMGWF